MAHDRRKEIRDLGWTIVGGVLLILALNAFYWHDVWATNEKMITYEKARAAG